MKLTLNSQSISVQGNIVAVDTETTGLDPYGSVKERGGVFPARPFVISFTDYDGHSSYISFKVDNFTREVIYDEHYYNMAKAVLEDESITKVFHNANFDLIMLWFAGINVKGRIFDTRIMAHVKNSGMKSHALKPLAIDLLNISDDDQKELKASVMIGRREGKKLGWALSKDLEADYHLGNPYLVKRYACLDTERTMGLFWGYEDYYNNDEEYRSVVDVELELLPIAKKMQLKGIRIDEDKLPELEAYYNSIIDEEIKTKAELGYAGLNVNSPKQMKDLFYGQLKCPPVFKKKKLTTDSSALSKWSAHHPIASTILRLKSAMHELDTFILPFKECAYKFNLKKDIAIHPNYNTVGPVTGRISCNAPNLMNISSNDSGGRKTDVLYRTRELFIPRRNTVLYFPDYSQVEVWLAMFLSGDPVGIEELLSKQDMHANTAKLIWGNREDFAQNKKAYRKKAKFILFGMIYGAGIDQIQSIAGCDYMFAREIRQAFHDKYNVLFTYAKTLINEVKANGFIKNPFGRCYYPPVGAEYKSLNYMVQGTAGDIMKRAMINLDKLFTETYLGSDILLTIHDEAGLEVPVKYHSKKLMKAIVKAMQGDFHIKLNIPCPLPVGFKYTTTNWAEMIELKELELAA